MITQTMSQIATELTATLTVEERPVEWSGVVPGDAVVADYGDGEDMAWVRLVTSYNSEFVGVVDERVGACATGFGVELEVGILRCFSPDPQGLEDHELLAMAEIQHLDMMTIRKVLICTQAYGEKDFILGAYRPLGPMGDMYGGAWTVMLGLV
jgi:hypothetical protein